MKNIIVALSLALLAFVQVGAQDVADPVWTAQYNFAQTPEANGFTRTLYNTPIVTTVTGGTPANRRVEINSTNGEAIFLTSNVPSLNAALGATAQMQVSSSGPGHAGVELTFLGYQFQVQVYHDRITVVLAGEGVGEHVIDTNANTATTTVRVTVDGSGVLRIYRNTVLIDTRQLVSNPYPFQRVLWWGEGGGTQTFRQLVYYIGGPVAP